MAVTNAGWEHELMLWKAGYQLVAGVDEVGRGAMAGPLVAAAVVLPQRRRTPRSKALLAGVRDSKMLSPLQRERLSVVIRRESIAWSVGEVSCLELDAIGLSAAIRLAMERAISGLACECEFLLLDAATVDLGMPQCGLIKGDRLSVSIAAASIIAKVWRDEFMRSLHQEYPQYGFEQHKGYCTVEHLAAVRHFGPSDSHRTTFSPVHAALDEWS